MRNHFVSMLLIVLLAACVPTQSAPSPEPSLTNEPVSITPVESAFAPTDATAAPLVDIIETHTVTFETPDGATITGELYGSGETAVIFSVMGDCSRGWREFAQLTAAQGFVTLTYQWRGCRESGSANASELRLFVDDLRGAITFMRDRGATKIILAGASLGGCASAKLAVESQADGLIVVASPPEIPEFGFDMLSADLATDIPKLFITAENDDTVSQEETRALFDLAAEPKQWQTYPGTAHGTDLFATAYELDVQQRILDFILAIANP